MKNRKQLYIVICTVLVIIFISLILKKEPGKPAYSNSKESAGSGDRLAGKRLNYYRDDMKVSSRLDEDEAAFESRRKYSSRLVKRWIKRNWERDKKRKKNLSKEKRSWYYNLTKLTVKDPDALMDAVAEGKYDVNDTMLNPNMRILDRLILKNRFEDAKLLIHKGALLDDESSDPPYHIALLIAPHGTLEQVKFINEHGADLHVKNECEENTFFLAARYGNLKVAEYLRLEGVSLNIDSPGVTPLFGVLRSAKHCRLENVKFLLGLGFKATDKHLDFISRHSEDHDEVYELVEGSLD